MAAIGRCSRILVGHRDFTSNYIHKWVLASTCETNVVTKIFSYFEYVFKTIEVLDYCLYVYVTHTIPISYYYCNVNRCSSSLINCKLGVCKCVLFIHNFWTKIIIRHVLIIWKRMSFKMQLYSSLCAKYYCRYMEILFHIY